MFDRGIGYLRRQGSSGLHMGTLVVPQGVRMEDLGLSGFTPEFGPIYFGQDDQGRPRSAFHGKFDLAKLDEIEAAIRAGRVYDAFSSNERG